MCGFTGFLTLSHNRKRSEMQAVGRRMADSIRHRGPDDSDTWQDPDTALLFAFRRLAIIDLSPEGRQPMHSATGRYTIVFNGEIYNFLELKSELERAGIKFRGRSDTEVILASAEHWGLNQTLQKINGMFAFAIWDRQEKKLHFARDRLGKKPLYIGWADDQLVFGSELKALRAHPDFKAELNPEAFDLYMQYGFLPAPSCIYKNTWSLPPGFRLTIDLETLEQNKNLPALMRPYWHHCRVLEEAKGRMISAPDDKVIGDFEELLTDCVRTRMISDVPLGAFLSGGLDSSTIVALMQKISRQPVKTYTIGFHEEGFDEAAHAKKIAAHLGTDHHELYLNAQDALDIIPSLPQIYDEPFADISAIPTYLVSKFARQDVTVALSGDGGDEMLGGYNRHIEGAKIWKRMKLLPRPVRSALANIIKRTSLERWDALMQNRPQFGNHMHKVAGFLSLDSPEQIYQNLLTNGESSSDKIGYLPKTILNSEFAPPVSLSFAEKMMYWDALFYLPNDILVKVDRASMANSLEVRAPLLDRRIYEYAWSLPEKFKIRDGQGKWLLRQVLKRHVPENMFERPKQGFSVPVAAWLRGPLKDWAEELLSEKNLQRLDSASIRQTWAEFQEGHGNHAQKLWTILMFQAWQKHWL